MSTKSRTLMKPSNSNTGATLLAGCLVATMVAAAAAVGATAATAATAATSAAPMTAAASSDHHLAAAAAATTVGDFYSPAIGVASRTARLASGKTAANQKQQQDEQLLTSASHQPHKHSMGKFYMFAESPKKGAYKMGFKRGNAKHLIERKESSAHGHVSSYFKWHDKKGKGSHKFEFKHKDHHKHKHHY